MKLTQHPAASDLEHRHALPEPAGEDGDQFATEPAARPEGSVFCQHSIHDGHFPVAGLTVGEARSTLAPLLNIDPEAVAVIDGHVVDEDRVIGEDVRALAFVKPSSVKG
jgi:hypothetical protein